MNLIDGLFMSEQRKNTESLNGKLLLFMMRHSRMILVAHLFVGSLLVSHFFIPTSSPFNCLTHIQVLVWRRLSITFGFS